MQPKPISRVRLAHLPTPLEAMPRLSAALGGPELWIKRDDQTGLAGGGNKTRKLEFLLGAAQAEGAQTLITGGAPQSNHCRQTAAAAAARASLRCVLVLGGHPVEPTGNILLDRLLGAEIVWTGDGSRDETMQQVFEREQAAGHKPYLIPYGGSSPVGASAYAAAIEELAGQLAARSLPPFNRIVFASSSGGTHSGLAVGVRSMNMPTQVLGISIDKPEVELTDTIVLELARQTAALLGRSLSFSTGDIHADASYLGGGYGVMGQPEKEAIHLFARHEGILLDPVYTGRAAAGLIDLIRRGSIARTERVLFWHTGGMPALFAPQYTAALMA